MRLSKNGYNNKFMALQLLMHSEHVTQEDLSKAIYKSRNYTSERMRAIRPWSLKDILLICDYLKVPMAEAYRYFPPEEVRDSQED